jgi:methylmalonyl-CoA/ethylmalonyl-CoA epimerase
MSDGSASPRAMFGNVVQIGAVVKDLERAIQVLSEVFGIGPFRVINWPPAGRTDIQKVYRGQAGSFTARMAFTELGPVELELIQPLTGESIWADFLEEHGEGLHHIRFNVSEIEPVLEYLAGHGIEVTQMGSGLRPGTAWANFDTEGKVGFTIEIMKALPGTDGRTPQIVDGKVQS